MSLCPMLIVCAACKVLSHFPHILLWLLLNGHDLVCVHNLPGRRHDFYSGNVLLSLLSLFLSMKLLAALQFSLCSRTPRLFLINLHQEQAFLFINNIFRCEFLHYLFQMKSDSSNRALCPYPLAFYPGKNPMPLDQNWDSNLTFLEW